MLAPDNLFPMASEKSTPNTPAVGAGLNAARHGRSDEEVLEDAPEEVPADTPLVPTAPLVWELRVNVTSSLAPSKNTF